MNTKLTVQYDGTRYLGWTRPEKDHYDKTVSFRLSSTLTKLLKEESVLFAGAKTESGVHAQHQVVNFQSRNDFSPHNLLVELNKFLPKDIKVLKLKTAPERFRADLNARSKTYLYHLCTTPVYDPFTISYSGHLFSEKNQLLTTSIPDIQLLNNGLDLTAMQEAAHYLMGTHNFKNFSGVKKKKGTEKEILDLTFSKTPDFLDITLTANDFLYQMPSRMIAVLIETGLHIRKPDSIKDILEGNEKAEALCDPAGLLLKQITY